MPVTPRSLKRPPSSWAFRSRFTTSQPLVRAVNRLDQEREETMRIARKRAGIGLFAALALTVSVAGVSGGRAQTAERKAEPSQGGTSGSVEVFCMSKSAGQLCMQGSADILKLDGAKRQRWNKAVRRYNETVDAATKQLLDEARELLSPEEYAKAEKWFDKSVNTQFNQALGANRR